MKPQSASADLRVRNRAAVDRYQREHREKYLADRRAARRRRSQERAGLTFACAFCELAFPTYLGRTIHEGIGHPGVVPVDRIEHRRLVRSERHKRPEVRARRLERNRGNPKIRARFAVWKAVKDGLLIRGSCAVCGATPVHGHHHRGYDRPLDVQWLCVAHHREAHRQLVAQRAA